MEPEALSRLATGECYLEAVRLLASAAARNEQSVVALLLPTNMLAGFSLELYLKGYLILNGVTPATTRSFGHDIKGLAAEASRLGLPAIDGMDDLIASLSEGHADFTYRYINVGGLTDMFDWPKVLAIFDKLTNEIGRELRLHHS